MLFVLGGGGGGVDDDVDVGDSFGSCPDIFILYKVLVPV